MLLKHICCSMYPNYYYLTMFTKVLSICCVCCSCKCMCYTPTLLLLHCVERSSVIVVFRKDIRSTCDETVAKVLGGETHHQYGSKKKRSTGKCKLFVNKFVCFDVVVYFFLLHPCNQVSGKPVRPVNQELQDLFSVLNYEKVCMIAGCVHGGECPPMWVWLLW